MRSTKLILGPFWIGYILSARSRAILLLILTGASTFALRQAEGAIGVGHAPSSSVMLKDSSHTFPVTSIGSTSGFCTNVCYCSDLNACNCDLSGTVVLNHNLSSPFSAYGYRLKSINDSNDCSGGTPVQLPVSVGVGQKLSYTTAFSPTTPGTFSDFLNLSGYVLSLSGSTPRGSSALVPYQLNGWSAPVVVSKTPGTQVDSPTLNSTDKLYASWAIENNGDLSTFGTFYIDLNLDGTLLQRWRWDDPLDPKIVLFLKDYPFGPLVTGTHTLELIPDSTHVTLGSASRYTKTLTVTQTSSAFTIISPASGQSFVLSEASKTATMPISFEAGGTAGSVNWQSSLEYQTSGHRPATPFRSVRTFQTLADGGIDETYIGQGGKITVTATAGGTGAKAKPITFLVTGTPIAAEDVTARLVSLYAQQGGATTRLMTGVAQKESSYLQFKSRSLYGTVAFWPLESASDHGSHIGLMMMPTTDNIAYAWNWQVNTSAGVNLFVQDKLGAARRKMLSIIQAHPGLRTLSPVELERMALLLYGPSASSSSGKQYYIPVKPGNSWMWAVNTSGNPGGVAYVDSCFNLIHQQ
ncbi:MAG: hypothetical protein WAM82_26195 [Thermoanaerobaculia bacterium]